MAFPKPRRVILTGEAYKALQHAVFTADHWRCLMCRKIRPLQLHHVQPRSLGRIDSLENAMSLCAPCHTAITDKRCDIQWDDVSRRTVRVTWRTSQ